MQLSTEIRRIYHRCVLLLPIFLQFCWLYVSKGSADKADTVHAEIEGKDGSQGLENVVKKWWNSIQRR